LPPIVDRHARFSIIIGRHMMAHLADWDRAMARRTARRSARSTMRPMAERQTRSGGPGASSSTGPAGGWRDHPDTVEPTVLVLGGFLTAPPMYRRFMERLRARGAAAVVVAGVWTPDWLIASVRGPGAIATRSGRALLEAGRLAAEVSEGAPVLIVGHSAGGLIARILTATEPLPDRKFGAARRVGAIVTLGTPHLLSTGEGIGRRLNTVVSEIAEAAVPGAFHSPEIGYVSVASRAIGGYPAGTGRERVAYLLYRSVMGRAAVPGTEGDGLVPVASAMLAGSAQIVVDGAIHGPSAGAPWYGTDGPMDVWWPAALSAWHEALAYRAAH
jgi:pimeloyl-ACP methyl ester carboxylesterase